jgi:hypothetical protein
MTLKKKALKALTSVPFVLLWLSIQLALIAVLLIPHLISKANGGSGEPIKTVVEMFDEIFEDFMEWNL